MSRPRSRLKVLTGCGLLVGISGVNVAEGGFDGVIDGWFVGVDVSGMGVCGISARSVLMGVGEITCVGRLKRCIRRLMPYANPPRTAKLITTSSAIPAGVMRIVHPTRCRRGRTERGGLFSSNWLAIIGYCAYFTRCKNCAHDNELSLYPHPLKV